MLELIRQVIYEKPVGHAFQTCSGSERNEQEEAEFGESCCGSMALRRALSNPVEARYYSKVWD